jgi:hypothetical protein
MAAKKKTKNPAKAKSTTKSKGARAHITQGIRLFALAGRPTKAQFVKVYGAKGPTMSPFLDHPAW